MTLWVDTQTQRVIQPNNAERVTGEGRYHHEIREDTQQSNAGLDPTSEYHGENIYLKKDPVFEKIH